MSFQLYAKWGRGPACTEYHQYRSPFCLLDDRIFHLLALVSSSRHSHDEPFSEFARWQGRSVRTPTRFGVRIRISSCGCRSFSASSEFEWRMRVEPYHENSNCIKRC